MKYFLHDTSAFDDEKITELYLKFGYEGLGLFYTCLEKIGKQEKPIKTTVLKAQLKVGKRLEKCWSFMEQIGILSSNNGDTFNGQLLNFSETYQIKKEKTRKKVSEWREKQKDMESVTSYVPVSNPPKVKESKVKESKEDNNIIAFENFWDLYDKNEDKIQCETLWMQLENSERIECITKLPEYVKSTPDKQFRKSPKQFIKNKSWRNEIIKTGSTFKLTPAFQLSAEDDLEYKQLKEKTYGNPV